MKKISFYFIIPIMLSVSCHKPEEPKVITFFGDSHIARYNTKYWYVDDLTINKGMPGAGIMDLVKEDFDGNKCIAVLQIGTNDILSAYYLNKSPEFIADSIFYNYSMLIEYIENERLFAKILITSIIPPNINLDCVDNELLNVYKEVNWRLNKLVREKPRFVFVNFTSILNKDHLDGLYTNDYLHLNFEGYRLITYHINEEL